MSFSYPHAKLPKFFQGRFKLVYVLGQGRALRGSKVGPNGCLTPSRFIISRPIQIHIGCSTDSRQPDRSGNALGSTFVPGTAWLSGISEATHDGDRASDEVRDGPSLRPLMVPPWAWVGYYNNMPKNSHNHVLKFVDNKK